MNRLSLPGPRPLLPFGNLIAMRSRTLEFLSEVAGRYGDIASFRVGGFRYVLLSHPEDIRRVLVTDAERFTKGPALRRARGTLGNGLLISEGQMHRRQRRLMQPLFHPKRVETYLPAIVTAARRVSDGWQSGRTIDIHEQMMGLTLTVVAQTLFGVDVEAKTGELGRAMSTTVNMFSRVMLPFGPLIARLPLPANRRFVRARALLLETMRTFIAQRRRQGASGGGDDLLSVLLHARGDEHDGQGGMSDQQLLDECMTIFAAGHETTANALTFTWYLLARSPRIEARLHEELERVLAGRSPTTAALPALPYTRAILAESMRLYPPAWAIARCPVAPYTLRGHTLSPGTVLLMSQWVVHHDPRWWPEPLTFDPGRWLGGDTARPRHAYFPFGGGPRQCIGESFAWMEAMLILATLAQRHRLNLLADAPATLALRPTITLRPRDPLPMTIQPRER